MDHGVGAAQCLEASQTKTTTFVFDVDRANSNLRHQSRQRHERRLSIVEKALDLVGCGDTSVSASTGLSGLLFGMRVEQKHDRVVV